MQKAFHDNHALQCGYCTPGMIMQAIDLLNENPNPDRGGDPGGARGQPVPLHRLPQHRQGRRRPARARRCPSATGEQADDRRRRPAVQRGRQAARRRKEDQRLITGRTRWTDNITLPGMLHLAMVRSPFAHAKITAIDTTAARRRRRSVSPSLTGEDLKDIQGVIITAWPITADQKTPDAPARWPSTTWPAPARSSPSSSPGRPPRPATPRSSSTSTTRSCRPVLDLKEAAADTVLAHPDLGTNRAPSGSWTRPSRAPAATSTRRSPKARERRHRHRARVPPAAAHPRLHGAPVDRRRPHRGADDHVVGHPGAAHPALLHRRDDGPPGVQGPGHRARRRWRLRRQAPEHARGVRHHRGRPSRSASRASTPRPGPSRWSRATTAATSGRS